MKKRMLIHLVLLCLAFSGQSQHYKDTLDLKLDRLYQQSDLPGFAVCIVSADGVLYQKGFGYADIAQRKPFTAQTLLNIGSISKTFIGLALMKAVEQGKIRLTDKINDYLPFEVVHPKFPEVPITIEHLATHTSSIPNTKYYRNSYLLEEALEHLRPGVSYDYARFISKREPYTLEEFLARILSKQGKWYSKKNFLPHAPGAQYRYSNLGAALAAFVLECAVGEPFDQYTRKHILAPIGMAQSGWGFDQVDMTRHAYLYFPDGAGTPRYRLITYPDGGLLSSVSDMALYQMEIIKGYYGKGKILKEPSYNRLLNPQLGWQALPKWENNIGVFWDITRKGYIGHNGGDPGMFSDMLFNPTTGIGKIVLTNISEDETTAQQFRAIWDTLGKYEERLSPH